MPGTKPVGERVRGNDTRRSCHLERLANVASGAGCAPDTIRHAACHHRGVRRIRNPRQVRAGDVRWHVGPHRNARACARAAPPPPRVDVRDQPALNRIACPPPGARRTVSVSFAVTLRVSRSNLKRLAPFHVLSFASR